MTDQWNYLPADVVRVTNSSAEKSSILNSFKNKLDKLWRGTEVYTNPDIDIHLATSARNIRRAHLNTGGDVDSDTYTDLSLEA